MVIPRWLPLAVLSFLIPRVESLAGEPTAGAQGTRNSEAAHPTPGKPGKRALEKDMTGATIISIIGKPDEITPMKSEQGKAETWVYRRKIGSKAVQVVVGERDVPAFSGLGGTGNDMTQSRKELIYGMKHVAIYRVTSILLFNDRLVTARQVDELSEKYE